MRSLFGLKALTKIFKAMDSNGSKTLDIDDFRWGLMDYGVQISKDEGAELLSSFSKDSSGINFETFLDQFRVSIHLCFFHLILTLSYRRRQVKQEKLPSKVLINPWLPMGLSAWTTLPKPLIPTPTLTLLLEPEATKMFSWSS